MKGADSDGEYLFSIFTHLVTRISLSGVDGCGQRVGGGPYYNNVKILFRAPRHLVFVVEKLSLKLF